MSKLFCVIVTKKNQAPMSVYFRTVKDAGHAAALAAMALGAPDSASNPAWWVRRWVRCNFRAWSNPDNTAGVGMGRES